MSLLHEWGPQAWIDMVMSKRMLVDRAGPLVPYTFLPILRMTADAEQIDDPITLGDQRADELRHRRLLGDLADDRLAICEAIRATRIDLGGVHVG